MRSNAVKVLILAEDFVKDEFLLQPIIQAMMKSVGKPKAKVKVCRDPRFHGTGEALKWEYVEQALRRHRGMVDLFLLCVDRDGNAHRHVVLGNLENEAKAVIGEGRSFPSGKCLAGSGGLGAHGPRAAPYHPGKEVPHAAAY